MRTRLLLTFWLPILVTLVLLLGGSQVARAEEDFLDPEVAFKLAARAVDARTVEVSYTVARGYYLYREQFQFSAHGATLGEPVLPTGKAKFDETFQKTVETYRDVVRIAVPVTQADSRFRLLVTNQGCADKGLCYPPQQRAIEVSLVGYGGDGSTRVVAANEARDAALGRAPAVSFPGPPASANYAADAPGIDGALRSGQLLTVVGVFFVAGLLLSLTPCVLPMLPILSSIIVAHGAVGSRGRGFALALSYSLGMALVYTALGVAAGLAGGGLAAFLQKPWVLVLFAAGLVLLSLSMFGVYDLKLPSALAGRLSRSSQRLPGGRFGSVLAMGGLSALIVSPCIAAPLAGALVYLSQTRDFWLGGSALFSLAAGMSVPLLLIGASSGALLPRVGEWMNEVKRFFGILLLGVALWTMQSVLPVSLVLALWGTLALGAAVAVVSHRHGDSRRVANGQVLRRSMAAVLAVGGLLQFVGAASGGSDPLQPLAHLRRGESAAATGPAFTLVRNLAELDNALRTAGRPVMLDFYADWCISCNEMERFTFVDPAVQKRMAGALLLTADVTANNDDDRALLKRFNLFGPPGTIFFDPQGRELPAARVAGYQDAARFLLTLQTAGL